jgi:hypothetical protein
MNDREAGEARLERLVMEAEARMARLEQLIVDLEVHSSLNAAVCAWTVPKLLFDAVTTSRARLECHRARKTRASQR